jgi:hypothetical protein
MLMRQQRLMTCMAAGLAVLVLAAGCGQNAAGSSSSQSGPTTTPGSQNGFRGTAGSVQAAQTGTLPATKPTRHPSTPTTPQPIRGSVTLRVIGAPQAAREAITFTLMNLTNQAIFFADHQSGCTAIILQMVPGSQNNGQWRTLVPCKALIMTRLHSLAADSSLTIRFNPPSGRWASGLYRGALSYSTTGTGGQGQTLYSSSFSIEG